MQIGAFVTFKKLLKWASTKLERPVMVNFAGH